MPLYLRRRQKWQESRSLLPRQRLVKEGEENLRDDELLAVVLGIGYRGRHVLEVTNETLKQKSQEELIKLDIDG